MEENLYGPAHEIDFSPPLENWGGGVEGEICGLCGTTTPCEQLNMLWSNTPCLLSGYGRHVVWPDALRQNSANVFCSLVRWTFVGRASNAARRIIF